LITSAKNNAVMIALHQRGVIKNVPRSFADHFVCLWNCKEL